MQRKVAGILEEKGTEIWSVASSDSVFSALETMAEHNIGAVLVLDGADLRGILTERDYARKVKLRALESNDTPVGQIMTTVVHTVVPTATVAECMQLMTDERVRHLPVVDDDGRLVGVVSIGDVVKAMIAQQRDLIADLERYITG
jgi:CBS domain-containing protein